MTTKQFDMSHEVLDMNGKLHSFNSEYIIPLKQKLFEKAVALDKTIEPCGKQHFNVKENELILWYNNTKNHSTKMAIIKLE